MVVGLTTLTTPLWVVAVVGTGLFVLTALNRGEKGAYSLLGIFGGAVLWAGGYALQLAEPSVWAHNLRFLGAGIVPVSIFVLALQLTGREAQVTLRNVLGVYAIPGVAFLCILTNGRHGLWADPGTVATAGVAGDPVAWGPVFYAASAYLLVLSTAAVVMFAGQVLDQDADSTVNTASVFLVVTAIPVVTYPLFMFGTTVVDWTPFTFVVSGLLMMAAMFYL